MVAAGTGWMKATCWQVISQLFSHITKKILHNTVLTETAVSSSKDRHSFSFLSDSEMLNSFSTLALTETPRSYHNRNIKMINAAKRTYSYKLLISGRCTRAYQELLKE